MQVVSIQIRNEDWPFFAYFNRAKQEGLSDTEAYRWAITEDIFSPDDVPLGTCDPRPNGMCYHPQCGVENLRPKSRWFGQRICSICGTLLMRRWVGPNHPRREIYWAPPTKIPTRRESALRFLLAAAARQEK